jgi:UDP-glucose 4-epimerase
MNDNTTIMKKRALVIGGLGFIGACLVSRLISKGIDVDVTTSTKSVAPDLRSVYSIPYNEAGFSTLLSKNEYEDIYFFSGNPSPSYSENEPYFDINLTNIPLLALLKSVVRAGFKGRLWFASSVAVYGGNNAAFLSEESECLPLSYYAVSKLMAEEHLKMYNRIHGLHTGIFRIFSTYGGGLKRQLVYDIYKKIKDNPNEILLHGTGNEARDLSYVQDQISAILAIAEKTKPNGEVWNIGAGELHTVNDVVDQLCGILGTNTRVKYQYPMRAYDGVCWRADVRKLRALNFEQQFTLATGLRETINAYEQDVTLNVK